MGISESVYYDIFASRFGELAHADEEVWKRISKRMDDGDGRWLKALAGEWLIRDLAGLGPVPSALAEAFAETVVFGETTLKEAKKLDVIPFVIPVNRPGCAAGQLLPCWGVRGAEAMPGSFSTDGREGLQVTPASFVPSGVDAGNSWQLGAGLAERILEDGRSDLIGRIARDWVVSGEVNDQERVIRVRMGNKGKVITGRQWLLPVDNLGGHHRECGVRNLQDAWVQFTGEGTLADGEQLSFPTSSDLDSVHVLASQAIRPMIANILRVRPALVSLWHSSNEEKSKCPAEMIREVVTSLRVREIFGHEVEVRLRLLPDSDINAAEQVLQAEGLGRAFGKPVLFDITGGNYLMKEAVSTIARRNPSIWRIYKEFGLGEHEVIGLRLSNGVAGSFRIVDSDPDPRIDWNFLSRSPDRTKGESDDAATLMKGIFGLRASIDGNRAE